MRDFDEFKLARVIDACSGVDGRVKMQKIVYVLWAMGYDLPFDDFVIRQHGPFSRGVAWATDALTEAKILEETPEQLGANADGEPIRQYSYRIRDEMAELIRDSFDVAAPPGKPLLDEIAPRLKGHDRAILEVAATRVYLGREGLSGDELEEELSQLKGHLADRFGKARELVEQAEISTLFRAKHKDSGGRGN